MKSLMLAGAMTLAMGTVGFAEGLHWVVGNRATNKCDIVTSNPVVMGDIRFQDGPYKSLADVISPARPSAPAGERSVSRLIGA